MRDKRFRKLQAEVYAEWNNYDCKWTEHKSYLSRRAYRKVLRYERESDKRLYPRYP